MFAVPLVSLTALWIFAASTTVASAVSDQHYNSGVRAIDTGFAPLTAGLPQEQAQSYLWLLSDRTAPEAPLLAAQNLVDRTIPVARNAVAPMLGQLSAGSKSALNALFADLAQLGSTRQAIENGTISPIAAFKDYSAIIDAQWQFYFAAIKDQGASFADVSIGATDASYALEMASREVTLVDGALADGDQMSAAARQLFAASAANRRMLMGQALALLTPSYAAGYASVADSPAYQQFEAMESQISASAGSSGPVPVDPSAWQSASGAYLAGMQQTEARSAVLLSASSASLSDRLITEAVLAGGVGLVAVVASVFLLVWFGRKVTRDLTRLDGSVRNMAEERLPAVVERLRRGDDVDVAAASPPPATSTIQEISQIAESFTTVQAAAVEAAVDQASLRKGVNQVFLNISMRNQSLLHRQLGMLDSMERQTTEPAALAELFRLDHLTTRMRRHAEGLIILSGSTPGRGWRDPVPVVDVLRAAVAEVEDYTRVDVVSESRDLVAGNAVSDIIHLVAELVENATVFSPPNTRIEVRADRVGTGLAAEIEDRGLGLTAEERDDINRRLTSPPEFDLANSDQLGLFVVSRLAARHNIRVSLRESVYGGTTAILLLPFGVVVREEDVRPRGDQGEGASNGHALPQGANGAAAGGTESRVDGAADLPFGLTGRHRLAGGAPGYRADADADDRTGERERHWAPRASPIAPWEFEQPSPTAPASAPTPAQAPTPAPAPGTAPAQPAAREPIVSPSRPPHEPDRPGPVSSGSHLGMPIRVPQASMAPQLRARRAAGAQAPADETAEAGQRSPEATRTMMTLMQQGWQRGRVDDLDDPEGAPGIGTDA